MSYRTLTRLIRKAVINKGQYWLSLIMPFKPMQSSAALLDEQYASGLWDYLADVAELPRFNVIAGYCHHYREGGKILEIGCGEGLLQERLCPTRYSRFVGVDISAEAIRRASRRQSDNILFVREDAALFEPDEKFDLIVFNECLEYFDDPLSLLRRYEQFLEKDGVYIVSMFVGVNTARARRIWKMIDRPYRARAAARVETRPKLAWTIKVYFPLQA